MDALMERHTAPILPSRDNFAVEMCWRNLLFCHWPIRAEALRRLIPPPLEIETFDGWAWIGIVPFHLTIRYRRIPLAISFPEVNVRTYVRHRDKSGVWFLSLHAESRLAVNVARWRYQLPYHLAKMSMHTRQSAEATAIHFESRRRSKRLGHGRAASKAALKIDYHPTGNQFTAEPGSLEHWLIERYQLFAADRHGNIASGRIHHPPWQLQTAEAEIAINSMLHPLGVTTPDTPPLLHFSRNVNCVAWKLRWTDSAAGV